MFRRIILNFELIEQKVRIQTKWKGKKFNSIQLFDMNFGFYFNFSFSFADDVNLRENVTFFRRSTNDSISLIAESFREFSI